MGSRLGRNVGTGLLLVLFVLGCSKPPYCPPAPTPPPPPASHLRTQKPYQIKGVWYYPLPTADGYVEEGLASWYGADFHGKPTACGERYDMWAMTAAHKTLPLGTHVKVTNLQNGNIVILRINDRGPFVAGRIIDLSCKGAQELGSYQKGLARVRVEAVQVASQVQYAGSTYWKADPVPSFRYGQFTVQIGAFREQSNATRLRDQMARTGQYAKISPGSDKGSPIYRVQVGLHQDITVAKKEAERLRSGGFGDAFVLAVEGK